MLLAVMLDRAALTLRNVAIAAFIILILWPESLLSVSFQMSFAATVSLIAGYEALRAIAARRPVLTERAHAGLLAWLRQHATTLLMTALLGGLATTPFAAYHFQRVAPLTLFANLAAMPAVTFIVMPMALATAILMPFGLETVPLAIMRYGIDWMTFVASKTAEWSAGIGSVRMIPAFAVLVAVTGFLWLALWRERWRLAGLAPLVAALPIALLAPQPDILIDQSGSAAAVRGSGGQFQIIGKGDKFEVENWLRADGDPRAADAKDTLSHITGCDALGCIGKLGDGREVALIRMPDALDEDCRTAAVIITRAPPPPGCGTRATVVDRDMLARGGSAALYRLPAESLAATASPAFRIETAYPAVHRPYMPPLEPSAVEAKAKAKSGADSGSGDVSSGE
jgi:competence protein ComEC